MPLIRIGMCVYYLWTTVVNILEASRGAEYSVYLSSSLVLSQVLINTR